MLIFLYILHIACWPFLHVKTWTDLKHRIKKKVLQTKSSRRQTGGGPCKIAPLNDIEKRVANIIGVRTVFGGPIEETTVVRYFHILTFIKPIF